MNDDDVITAMLRYGGGFVGALAIAARRADAENLTRLKAAFPDIWRQYADLAAIARPVANP